MTRPSVSVLIDTYNQAHFLEQAVCSALEQGLSPSELEILIVDDGSTDDTAVLAAKFAPRVQYLRKPNGGQISAYNFAVPETHAPIVAFLDADDWWAKGKLKAILDVFDKEPSVSEVGHGFTEFHDQTHNEVACLPGCDYRLDLSSENAARFAHSGRRFLATSKLAVRRAVLDRLGALPDDLIFFDGPVHLFALALGSALILNQPLAFYRIHGQNLYESQNPDLKILRRKCQIIDAQTRFLPPLLTGAGVPTRTISALLQPQQLDRERMRIDLEGAWPWETFGLEVRRFRASYQQHSLFYRAFKWLALAPALFMPPKRFYQLRDWYSRSSLRKFRKILGEPTPIAEIEVQKFNHST
jgi:glycosyltransferase involved in cell wall biosynthesis